MKNHTHLIRLVVITAALIGLVVMAFEYLRNIESVHAKNNVVIQFNKSGSIHSNIGTKKNSTNLKSGAQENPPPPKEKISPPPPQPMKTSK